MCLSVQDEMIDTQFLFLGGYSTREGRGPEGSTVHIVTE